MGIESKCGIQGGYSGAVLRNENKVDEAGWGRRREEKQFKLYKLEPPRSWD